jgi:tetratricopeptide (TPR) repeat protein
MAGVGGSVGWVAIAAMYFAVQALGQAPAQRATAADSGSSATSLTEAQRLIDRGHAAEALQRLDAMAAATPEPAGVERLRGFALYSQNRLREAERAFAAALAQDPADATAEQMRGTTLFRLGRPVEAIPLLEAAVKAAAPKPDSADGQPESGARSNGPADPEYVLALCYIDTKRYDDARRAFATQYGFPGDSAAAYLLAARMLLRREYVPMAEQFAHKALELSPQLPEAHLLLGEAALAGNHLDEAIAEFERERQLNPLDAAAYGRLGDAYIRRGEYDPARRSLQEAVLLDPNSTGPFILLGKALLKQQDAAGASAYLEHARQMDPQNYMTHSLLGQAYRMMGRLEDARTETETAQRLQDAGNPKLVDAK